MAKLTPQEIAGYALQAGWDPKKIPEVVAIAQAESSGDPLALNPNVQTGDESYGLMQINMLGAMGPERLKQFGLKSKEQLYDPVTNLKAAKKIYEQQGPGAWSVYKSGKYKEFLPEAYKASQSPLIKPKEQKQQAQQIPTQVTSTGQPNINVYLMGGQEQEETQQPGLSFLSSYITDSLKTPQTRGSSIDIVGALTKAAFDTPNYFG